MKIKFVSAFFLFFTSFIFSAHAGGAGATQTGGSAQGAQTAAQLAAALNAMNEGSARLSGNTVTLTGDVRVEGDLPIPSGDTIINGNGTINLTGKGSLFTIGEGKKLTLDGVTLVGVADNNEPLVLVAEGGELVLVSGKITGNTHVSDNFTDSGDGVEVNGGIFTMESGTISGNTTTNNEGGGGVFVIGNGVFTMKDGAITGNTEGGVLLLRGGTFNMKGGTISGNTIRGGGSVRMSNGGTFNMKGGTISGNTASGSSGGVVVNNSTSTFTMIGGRIQSNTDSDGFTRNGWSLRLANNAKAKWGEGGTYTKGGVTQTGGSDITDTNDTLIAIPAR